MTPGQDTMVLGIETSCDETAAAVVVRDGAGHGRILSNIVRSQWESHRPYGGVVPEIAARAHVECLDEIIAEALRTAGCRLAELDAVAATAGPGLIGGLIVGLTTAKSIALVHGKPLVAVNHLEAHALTVGLSEGLAPPYLLLLVSGGHTQLLAVDDVGRYVRLGTTIDDALGEAFDKTAKLLGLPYPGGAELAQLAEAGRSGRCVFPRPMLDRPGLEFSFSGLKTAALVALRGRALTEETRADVARGFQEAVVDTLAEKSRRALRATGHRRLVVAGGVGANRKLRERLADVAAQCGARLYFPRAEFCTDNGAMIALAGCLRMARAAAAGGKPRNLAVSARANWPLEDTG